MTTGQGGSLVLLNATPYTWRQTHIHSYQMNHWSFPATLAPGGLVRQYVEFDTTIGHYKGDDGGEVNYEIDTVEEGKNYTFQIQARAPTGKFNLQVQLLNDMVTQGNGVNSLIQLGWSWNGSVNWIISQNPVTNELISTGMIADWMQANLTSLGNRPLRHLCIPGSHDCGMSTLGTHTAGVDTDNVITQLVPVGQQLRAGSRYFDIRAGISSGTYMTGHYSIIDLKVKEQPFGGNGQSMQSIIDDVNAFTALNAELIILDVSSYMNTDQTPYRKFNQVEYDGLLNLMLSINHRYVAQPYWVDLTKMRLNQFIGHGQPAVIIIADPPPGVTLGNFARLGFYPASQINIYNDYANKPAIADVAADQLAKFETERGNGIDSSYFLLSWTCTQSIFDSIITGVPAPYLSGVPIGLYFLLGPWAGALAGIALIIEEILKDENKWPTIIQLGLSANARLCDMVWPKITPSFYPNIIFIDVFCESSPTAFCMAINNKTTNW